MPCSLLNTYPSRVLAVVRPDIIHRDDNDGDRSLSSIQEFILGRKWPKRVIVFIFVESTSLGSHSNIQGDDQ